MPSVGDIRSLVGPTEGDGDLRPGTIARVGDGIFCVDGEHSTGGELLISSALGGGEATEDDGDDHFVVILEGVVVTPRWSAASGPVVIVVVWLFGLELLSQAEAVLHLMLAVLVEGARAFEDLLVLLVVVTLGMRFVNGGDEVGSDDIDQIWTLLADHGHCPDGDYGHRSGGHCGVDHRVARCCDELGDECPYPH